MDLRVVGTGSSGNCYILKKDKEMIILDAGIPLPQIYEAVNFRLDDVIACLCTHAHVDHSLSAKNLLTQYVPVIMSDITSMILALSTIEYPSLNVYCPVTIGDWTFKSFPVEHDAPGTIGFMIGNKTSTDVVCYITDAGFVKASPMGVRTLIIECNYIDDLINWSELTEQQIRLKQSHMSLARLVSYVSKIDQSNLKNIVLVHLSDRHSNEQRMIKELQNVTTANIYAARAGMEIEL